MACEVKEVLEAHAPARSGVVEARFEGEKIVGSQEAVPSRILPKARQLV
jgi:hypothetical protein